MKNSEEQWGGLKRGGMIQEWGEGPFCRAHSAINEYQQRYAKTLLHLVCSNHSFSFGHPLISSKINFVYKSVCLSECFGHRK